MSEHNFSDGLTTECKTHVLKLTSGLHHIGLQEQAFGSFITSMKSEKVVDSKYNTVASTLIQEMAVQEASQI